VSMSGEGKGSGENKYTSMQLGMFRHHKYGECEDMCGFWSVPYDDHCIIIMDRII
jgi:hypothetical protein